MAQAQQTVVCDIDGTLCDDQSRRNAYLTATPDWSRYFASCHPSLCVEETAALVRDYIGRGYRVIFVTGRPESLRRETQWFLKSIGLKVGENELLMRDNRNNESEAELKTKFMKRILEGGEVIAALDCRSAVREAYESLGVRSFGPPHDIEYPPYAVPAKLDLTANKVFYPRYNFRRRVDSYCSNLFGETVWRVLRDDLLDYFNSKTNSPKFAIREVKGEPRFFSLELLTRKQRVFKEISESAQSMVNTWSEYGTYSDEKPERRNGFLYYFADIFEPPYGKRLGISLDGEVIDCSYGPYGWTHPIAGFFAEGKEPVKRCENRAYEYTPIYVVENGGGLPKNEVPPDTRRILRRIECVLNDGKFTYENFAADVKDPESGEVYGAFAPKTGEHWIRKLEGSHFLKTYGGSYWKSYNIEVTPRYEWIVKNQPNVWE